MHYVSLYRISISNLGNIFNPSDDTVDENDTAVIISTLALSRKLNFTILATTSYLGEPELVSISSEACYLFLDPKINVTEIDDFLWAIVFLFVGIFIGSCSILVCIAILTIRKKRKRNTVAPALIAAIMGAVSTLNNQGS